MSTDHQKISELIFTMNRLTKEGMEYGLNSLSFAQLQTLSFVYRKHNPAMKEIAEYLHITPPSATSLVNNLLKLGLIKRVSNKSDKRSTQLVLTTKGEKELQKGFKEAQQCLEKRLGFLSDKDKKEFLRILTKLSRIFNTK